MQAVFFKSETTGFFSFNKEVNDESQPHIVSLSAVKVDLDKGIAVELIDFPAIHPEGWEISDEAVKVHGVTMDKAKSEGVTEAAAIRAFIAFTRDCPLYSYGSNYNRKVIAAATHRYCDEADQVKWNDKSRHHCVQSEARKLITGKIPKLADAFRHFTGQDLLAPYTAQQNVDACKSIFFAMQK
jgi:DNA polymerase-3 subunit epsilon